MSENLSDSKAVKPFGLVNSEYSKFILVGD